jgi:DNA-binding MarR family transcriptional regulator
MNGERKVTRMVERASQRVRRHLGAQLDRLDITDLEAHLLARLAAKGPHSIADLSKSFGLRASTLTNAVDRLERKGFLRREPNPANRRTVLLALTPGGRRSARTVTALVDSIEAAVSQQVTRQQLDGFHAVIAALERAVE